MAKKEQQLQTEINSDEELDAFLERKGVLVIDVYSWAGPCVGMFGYLKKAKLGFGGDNMHLAIARSDSIEKLKRFKNKSEPVLLFCSHGKVVNMMFGCNVPKLMDIIIQELQNEEQYRLGQYERFFYDFSELMPEEREREAPREQLAEETERLEIEQADLLRQEFIRNITDQIMDHILDMGVTLFMPHVMEDVDSQIAEVVKNMELTCKESKRVRIKPEMLEMLHYEIENPLPDEILEYLYTKDVLMCLWQLSDTDMRTPEEVLNIFLATVTAPSTVYDESGEEIISEAPAILESIDFVPDYEPITEAQEDEAQTVLPTDDENGEPVEKLVIPPCWTPQNKRANAAFIFTFFRKFTDHFFEPDVAPVPQYLLFVFDAYKRYDVFETCKSNMRDVLSYGYFNSEDVDSCALLAKTTDEYETLEPTVDDMLMMKIAKHRSDVATRLAEMCPGYVSKNTIDGKCDCDKLFPPDLLADEN